MDEEIRINPLRHSRARQYEVTPDDVPESVRALRALCNYEYENGKKLDRIIELLELDVVE